jgi:hypothetical protein
MPCIPALFRIADSERRKAVEIRLTGAPLSANSRRRLTSSRDHAWGLFCLRLNVGSVNLSARIVILTSSATKDTARDERARCEQPYRDDSRRGRCSRDRRWCYEDTDRLVGELRDLYCAKSRSNVNPRLSMKVRACSRESKPDESAVHSCTLVRL